MTGIPLFIAEPAGTCRLLLRRFRSEPPVEGHAHDISVVIDEAAPESQRGADGVRRHEDDRVPHDDPRWPSRCDCGEPFTEADRWQVNELSWYEGGGRRFAWGIGSWDGPAGAMIRAPWRDDTDDNGLPAWIVFLPNGTWWCTRDRASAAGGMIGSQWSVSGRPPLITVSPSIDDRGHRPWHGWIRDGHLVDA